MVAALIFAAAGAAIILASSRIVHCADIVAERTRLGQLWVGATMLAAVTSLPEPATNISAVRIDAPNLAAGDLFGSSMANMLIFAALSLWFARWWRNHRFSTVEWFAWAISPPGNGRGDAVHLFRRGCADSRPRPRRQELAAEAIIVGGPVEPAELTLYDQPLRRTFAIFFAWSAVVLEAAPFLANAAEDLAEITNLGDTFFGVISLAILTSLPELSSSIAAFRRGLPSMVLGNLLGSNGFNMLIIFALDISLPSDSFLQIIDEAHALAALDAIIMMVAAMGGALLLSHLRQTLGKMVLAATILFYSVSMYLIYILTTKEGLPTGSTKSLTDRQRTVLQSLS